jgi:YegS/Rv2252/BmrU family lipid kinase
MLRYKIIVNPISGRGTGLRSIPQIETTLKELDINYELVTTECPWHAVDLAQEASSVGFDVVVSAGGDGTANEVLNGLMQDRLSGNEPAAMGILAVGRGNDFAYSMGIPLDYMLGCQTLKENQRRWIDVGRVIGGLFPAGRYFGNGVGIGFDAVVGFEALKMKRLHGFASYLVGALKTIFLYFHAPRVQIDIEDETITTKALMVSVMNGIRLGGGFMMAPHGNPEDGLFDLTIAQQVSRVQIFFLISKFMKGTQASHAAILTGQARKIRVTSQYDSLPAHADGETLCVDGNSLSLEIFPKQLQMIYMPKKPTP